MAEWGNSNGVTIRDSGSDHYNALGKSPYRPLSSTYKKGTMKYTKEQQLQKKVEKLEGRVKKSKLTPLPKLRKQVQTIVNAYVRERDAELGCISCGTKNANWNAGHYIAQGSSGLLRYNLKNLSKQCVGCNLFKHGNLVEYRIGLVKKIGLKEVGELENKRHEVHSWTREELEDIKRLIKEKKV